MHWLASEFDKIVSVHKENMPNKAIRSEYPSFLWLAPPQHKNFHDNHLRSKMTRSIKSALIQQKSHMMLTLKKIWDYENGSLHFHNKFTSIGFETFWQSADSAIQFWDRHLAPRKERSQISSGKNKVFKYPG